MTIMMIKRMNKTKRREEKKIVISLSIYLYVSFFL